MPDKISNQLLDYLNISKTAYHAVAETGKILSSKGVHHLEEKQIWKLQEGKAGWTMRNSGTLCAFRIPQKHDPHNVSFQIAAAHTDSPGFRLKPAPAKPVHGYMQWGVEVYGGPLFNTWVDRDLGVAGKIGFVENGHYKQVLVDFEGLKVRIPQLAIHLDREANEELKFNRQTQLKPIFGMSAEKFDLWSMLEEKSGHKGKDLAFDLFLYDTQPADYGGMQKEFIYGGKLDNLAMCHAIISAFSDLGPAENCIQIACLFDHEEIGSLSSHGAQSAILTTWLERIALGCGLSREEYLAALSRSQMLSADMAHGLHPNFPEKHDADLAPRLNGGPVLKINAGQKYATDISVMARFKNDCKKAGVSCQEFVSRNDIPCGSTIGPVSAARTTINTTDIGSAMLSMHSIREIMGTEDASNMTLAIKEFFKG